MDGLFDFRVVEVPFSKYNQPISLYPISDVHYNNPNFARDKWEDLKEEVKKDRNQKYFLILGDTLDTFSTSERKILFSKGLHDSTITKLDQDVDRDIKEFLKEVPFMKDRTLAVFGGNHRHEFQTGITSDMKIADGLNSQYIGTAGFIALILRYDQTHAHEVVIFAHHGTSDARMRKCHAHFRCDLLLMGHLHTIKGDLLPEIHLSSGMGGKYKIQQHETRLLRTGSFLKSYEAGMKSYAVSSAMPPAVLGCPRAIITPKRTTFKKGNSRSDERWVDIKVTF